MLGFDPFSKAPFSSLSAEEVAVLSSLKIPIEIMTSISKTRRIPVESLLEIITNNKVPVELLGSLLISNKIPKAPLILLST